MSTNGKLNEGGLAGAENSTLACLIIALAVYFVRIMPWALSEFWYDEVLTLGDFVLDPGDKGIIHTVFRNYPIANNHILSTAVYWVWVRILNFGLEAEQMVRLPSMLFGALLIALPICHWKKWLGAKVSALTGFLFAISPVFTAYAYQIRGYSLSMLLAGVAISGAMESIDGDKRKGLALTCISCLLLPLVIPSNVIFIPVLAAMIWFKNGSTKEKLLVALPPFVCGILGGSYYFTIWKQFVAASKEPGGWKSAWMVAGNLLLAFAAHGLVILITSLQKPRKKATEANQDIPETETSTEKQDIQAEPAAVEKTSETNWPRIVMVISVATAVIIAGLLLVSRKGQAPYPRVFLIFLPITTLALMLIAKKRLEQLSFSLLVIFTLANGLVWERFSTAFTEASLKKGISPSNLLQQYYRGSDDLRTAASKIQKENPGMPFMILADEYDQPTLNFYWLLNGGKPGTVNTRNTLKQDFAKHINPHVLISVAKTPEIAAELFEYSGIITKEKALENFGQEDAEMQLVMPCGIRSIYMLRRPQNLEYMRRFRKNAVQPSRKNVI